MGILDGKVAVVTGAGRGIGRAEAMCLAAEGAAVIVNDLGCGLEDNVADKEAAEVVATQIRESGGTAILDNSDVSSWKEASVLVERSFDEFGGLDILVNNAGNLRDRTIAKLTSREWDEVISVHLRGHAAMLHHAARRWRIALKSGIPISASVVNTASEVGLFGNPGQVAYAAAKGGIIAMTLTAARELARYGVRSNVVCPRARTRMTEHAFGADSMGSRSGFDEWAPENVAPFVAYLGSDEAKGINGQVFVVGGSRVRLQQGWTDAAVIENESSAFDVAAISSRVHELFDGRLSVPVEPEMLPGMSRA
jgi:NAD(P)-dependent dehydrogenase (short-subunit alcohol dehydrogenase family)|tara:strand:+ start:14840 stop:15766 length:927 start_codon:yes stop_codon:yes gene_type:complete